jgi:DNA invertase Pin-like site-specific DNA recombinase
MRTGISITLKPADRRRLKALARDRNAPHKHVWRAEIVLLSADGVGTNEIRRRTGKSKTCVWRWQERFMQEGYTGIRRRGGKRAQLRFEKGYCRLLLAPGRSSD